MYSRFSISNFLPSLAWVMNLAYVNPSVHVIFSIACWMGKPENGSNTGI